MKQEDEKPIFMVKSRFNNQWGIAYSGDKIDPTLFDLSTIKPYKSYKMGKERVGNRLKILAHRDNIWIRLNLT